MNTVKPPDPGRLEDLARSLDAAAETAGTLTTAKGRRVKGLVFMLGDMAAADVRELLDEVDLSVPLSGQELKTLSALREIAEENRRLCGLASTDGLTGLFNARYFRESLGVEMERVRRTDRPLTLVMIDLDGFKPVNDTFGHQKGDELLRDVSEIIRANIRAVDVAARYGGDEFALILPASGISAGYKLAERVRRHIAEDRRTSRFGVTASVGLATMHPLDSEDRTALVEKADRAMYEAKARGGNNVWYWEADDRREREVGITVSERDSLYFRLDEG